MRLTDTYNLKIEEGNLPETMKLTFFGDSPKTLMHTIMDLGDLVSYQEMLPTMNDIFIQEVQSQNTKS